MSPCGDRIKVWEMPTTAGKVCGVQIASLYKEIAALCKEPPLVFIEKVLTKPTDGRVGLTNYFKGAGLLEMIHLWGWSVTLVSPATWCAAMHKGLPGDVKAKDRSRLLLSQKWPQLYQRGSILWPGVRTTKPHEGLMDAFLIAEWGRRQAYLSAPEGGH